MTGARLAAAAVQTLSDASAQSGARQQLGNVSVSQTFLDYLIEKGQVGSDSLGRIEAACLASGEPVSKVLTQLGFVTEDNIAAGLSEFLGLPVATVEEFHDIAAFPPLSASYLKHTRALPLKISERSAEVGFVDPSDPSLVADFEFALGKPVHPRILREKDFDHLFERHFQGSQSNPSRSNSDENATAVALDDLERLQDGTSTAPVVRLVSTLISDAVDAGASDIHVEPTSDFVRIRYRIDGVLNEMARHPSGLALQIVSRLKILARLDISEKRLPQDGRIRLAVRGRDIDFRVATTPAMHGESVVLRILDRHSVQLDLTSLGFAPEQLKRFRAILNRPHGILLVTGPTGSGKTTTLYASLLELNSVERKLLTIEDPVEYQLPGINQVQVRPAIGLTFSHALRAFLRQDPDIMMVGEIRDLETAQIAVQAALTGHLILSTLHTNDAASAITRLLDMGLENYLLASTINGIVGQRLVRRLCPACREPFEPAPDTLRQLGCENHTGPLYRAVGCKQCHSTGYKGRQAIAEILPITEEIHSLVIARADASAIRSAALREGMESMFAAGRTMVHSGQTTVDELWRVIRDI